MKRVISIVLLAVFLLAVAPIYDQIADDPTISIVAQAAKEGINKKNVVLVKGEKVKLKVYDKAKKITWKSSDETVVTVSSKGVVKALQKGQAFIIAKADKKKYKCKISVEAPKINKKEITLLLGDEFKLKINGTKQTVNWSTTNSTIASVSSEGTVTALKEGNAVITGNVSSKNYSCKVTVENPSISDAALEIKKGESVQLRILGTSQPVTWKSENEQIASVSADGMVIGNNKGNVYITGKVAEKEFKCHVDVVVPTGSITGNITYKYNNYRGNVADTGATVILLPKDGTAKNMEVSSYVLWTVAFSNDPMEEYKVYKTKVDGTGQYYFDSVPIGQYQLFVISNQTSDGDWFDDEAAYEDRIKMSTLGCLSEDAAEKLAKCVMFHKYTFTSITVRENSTAHYSHDFGITYI